MVDVEYDEERDVYVAGSLEFTEDDIVSYNSSDQPQLEDEYGEFYPGAGTLEPEPKNVCGATKCNALLKHWESRYNEERYCARAQLRDEPYCPTHLDRKEVDKLHMRCFETGAYLKSYENLMQYLPVHKKVLAVDIFESLIDESKYDFETVTESSELESPIGADEDVSVDIEIPIPTEHKARCQSLWYAALEFVKIQNINEKLFEDAHGVDEAVGEREQVVASGEDGPVYDRDEHHLNLPLSRIQSKYKDHLQFGGVNIDGDEIAVSVGTTSREFKEIEPPDE